MVENLVIGVIPAALLIAAGATWHDPASDQRVYARIAVVLFFAVLFLAVGNLWRGLFVGIVAVGLLYAWWRYFLNMPADNRLRKLGQRAGQQLHRLTLSYGWPLLSLALWPVIYALVSYPITGRFAPVVYPALLCLAAVSVVFMVSLFWGLFWSLLFVALYLIVGPASLALPMGYALANMHYGDRRVLLAVLVPVAIVGVFNVV